MELIDMSGAARLVLHPVSYEFENAIGNVWDDNWLVIAGEVACEGHEWSFQEPSLLVDEAVEIANWLERVATRVEAPTKSDPIGTVDASLAFVEPNLAFSVLRYGQDTAVIRVHFSAESLPPDYFERVAEAADPILAEMQVTLAAAASAAVIWRKQIAAYPRR
ncbi:hypothetical protein K2F54_12265 [Cryobacterium sp. 1639]|uniref:WapI family immunity protein n=1 Tax=Cryobacterium inferilacus TaxID=2866629 RepID=UPI001C73377B|nr:hypothetical protein [Cryobacterium sp. 1639]MBX0300747.1 hypothetical protein [Cryobacterium sp. 1639]